MGGFFEKGQNGRKDAQMESMVWFTQNFRQSQIVAPKKNNIIHSIKDQPKKDTCSSL